jgi:hypothetical protein
MTTAPFSPDDIRAAAEVHAELGADYHDAVVESFLAKVDREIEERVDARLAASRRTKRRGSGLISAERHGDYPAGLISGLVLGTIATGIPFTFLARRVAILGVYHGWEWHGNLWLLWALIAVVDVAGVAIVTTWIRQRRQLARATQSNSR